MSAAIVHTGIFTPFRNVEFFPVRKNDLDFGILWLQDSKNAALPLFLDMLPDSPDLVLSH